MTPDSSPGHHPLADRIETVVDALPAGRQLVAGRELLLAEEDDLERVVEYWERQASAA